MMQVLGNHAGVDRSCRSLANCSSGQNEKNRVSSTGLCMEAKSNFGTMSLAKLINPGRPKHSSCCPSINRHHTMNTHHHAVSFQTVL
eukprot:1143188-Pelagomonas_calceolata.AAC.5